MHLLKKIGQSAMGVPVGVKLEERTGQGRADFCQECNCSGLCVWLFFKGHELIYPDQSQNVQWTKQDTIMFAQIKCYDGHAVAYSYLSMSAIMLQSKVNFFHITGQ